MVVIDAGMVCMRARFAELSAKNRCHGKSRPDCNIEIDQQWILGYYKIIGASVNKSVENDSCVITIMK